MTHIYDTPALPDPREITAWFMKSKAAKRDLSNAASRDLDTEACEFVARVEEVQPACQKERKN